MASVCVHIGFYFAKTFNSGWWMLFVLFAFIRETNKNNLK